VVFIFTKQAFARIAGRKVDVGCTALLETGVTGYPIETAGAGQMIVVPRYGRRLTIPPVEPADYCTVKLARTKRAPPTLIAAVPVSERGAIYLSRRQTATDVFGVLFLATLRPKQAPPPFATIQRLLRGQAFALAGPNTRPPAHLIGYWTDGRAEVYVAELTYNGDLFFFDYHADTAVVTTNILGWMGPGLDL
jgi:hypothetical protein